ncbi:MAG: FCD domain-containing protein [Anaerolineales bacterium]|nr:FCD domain-containing protein [Anaerolineales bacterium]
MVKPIARRSSVRDLIYDQIESDIINAVMLPGQEIEIAAIADQWGVSRTPVREALFMLEANGLIEFGLRGQPLVRKLSPKEVDDTYFILATLEGAMAKLGAEKIGISELARMKGLIAECEVLVEANEYASFREATLRFREVVYEQCGNKRLVDLVSSLWIQVRPYGTWLLSQPGMAAARLERDHKILQACEQGDAVLVQKLVYEGVELAGKRIVKHLLEDEASEGL